MFFHAFSVFIIAPKLNCVAWILASVTEESRETIRTCCSSQDNGRRAAGRMEMCSENYLTWHSLRTPIGAVSWETDVQIRWEHGRQTTALTLAGMVESWAQRVGVCRQRGHSPVWIPTPVLALRVLLTSLSSPRLVLRRSLTHHTAVPSRAMAWPQILLFCGPSGPHAHRMVHVNCKKMTWAGEVALISDKTGIKTKPVTRDKVITLMSAILSARRHSDCKYLCTSSGTPSLIKQTWLGLGERHASGQYWQGTSGAHFHQYTDVQKKANEETRELNYPVGKTDQPSQSPESSSCKRHILHQPM